MLYSTDDLDLLLRLVFGITAVETGFQSQQIQHALIKLLWCQFGARQIPDMFLRQRQLLQNLQQLNFVVVRP